MIHRQWIIHGSYNIKHRCFIFIDLEFGNYYPFFLHQCAYPWIFMMAHYIWLMRHEQGSKKDRKKFVVFYFRWWIFKTDLLFFIFVDFFNKFNESTKSTKPNQRINKINKFNKSTKSTNSTKNSTKIRIRWNFLRFKWVINLDKNCYLLKNFEMVWM